MDHLIDPTLQSVVIITICAIICLLIYGGRD